MIIMIYVGLCMCVWLCMIVCMHACIYMCVCAWNIWIHVKLLPVDVDVHCFISTLSTLTDVLFPRTVASFQFDICSRGAQKAHRAVPNEALYGVLRALGYPGWSPGRTCINFATVSMSFFGNGDRLSQEPAWRFSHILKPNSYLRISIWCHFIDCTVFAICHALAMETFRYDTFSGRFTDPLLSGTIGALLHVRCIPHQKSQRLFWASVWFMLVSSRWHEPFGEYLSR